MACQFATLEFVYLTEAYRYRTALALLGLYGGLAVGLVLLYRVVFISRLSRFVATGVYLLCTFVLLLVTQLFTACSNGDCF